MATTNHDRVGKAMELLRDGLAPFVQREVTAKLNAERSGLSLSGALRKIRCWRTS